MRQDLTHMYAMQTRNRVRWIQRFLALLVLLYSAAIAVAPAFAQGAEKPAAASEDNHVNDSNFTNAATVRRDYTMRDPNVAPFVPPEVNADGLDVVENRKSQGPGVINHAASGPVYVWPVPIPAATSPVPTMRDTGIQKHLLKTYGLPISDTQYQMIHRYNQNILLSQIFDPERIMWTINTTGAMQAQSMANSAANLARAQAASAIDYCSSTVYNFTVQPGNKWNAIRDRLFIPMAMLLLLPGAVLTQVKAIVAGGTPVIGDVSSPFEGILRSIVAVFLIPATYLVINYGIDVSNSIAFEISRVYQNMFGNDMYRDALCAEVRAFPVRQPQENSNTMEGDAKSWTPQQAVNPNDPRVTLESMMYANKMEDPCGGKVSADADRNDERAPIISSTGRMMANGSNAALCCTWNILCAFQLAYLYYLWCVGPVVAALWVWPMKQLRDALGSWCEGVLTLCFWSLFWNTVILLMACFRGVDETGTLYLSALNFLANQAVKSAFDFAGLVKAAGSSAAGQAMGHAASAAQAGGSGASSGSAGARGGHGSKAGGGRHGASGAAGHAIADGGHGAHGPSVGGGHGEAGSAGAIAAGAAAGAAAGGMSTIAAASMHGGGIGGHSGGGHGHGSGPGHGPGSGGLGSVLSPGGTGHGVGTHGAGSHGGVDPGGGGGANPPLSSTSVTSHGAVSGSAGTAGGGVGGAGFDSGSPSFVAASLSGLPPGTGFDSPGSAATGGVGGLGSPDAGGLASNAAGSAGGTASSAITGMPGADSALGPQAGLPGATGETGALGGGTGGGTTGGPTGFTGALNVDVNNSSTLNHAVNNNSFASFSGATINPTEQSGLPPLASGGLTGGPGNTPYNDLASAGQSFDLGDIDQSSTAVTNQFGGMPMSSLAAGAAEQGSILDAQQQAALVAQQEQYQQYRGMAQEWAQNFSGENGYQFLQHAQANGSWESFQKAYSSFEHSHAQMSPAQMSAQMEQLQSQLHNNVSSVEQVAAAAGELPRLGAMESMRVQSAIASANAIENAAGTALSGMAPPSGSPLSAYSNISGSPSWTATDSGNNVIQGGSVGASGTPVSGYATPGYTTPGYGGDAQGFGRTDYSNAGTEIIAGASVPAPTSPSLDSVTNMNTQQSLPADATNSSSVSQTPAVYYDNGYIGYSSAPPSSSGGLPVPDVSGGSISTPDAAYQQQQQQYGQAMSAAEFARSIDDTPGPLFASGSEGSTVARDSYQYTLDKQQQDLQQQYPQQSAGVFQSSADIRSPQPPDVNQGSQPGHGLPSYQAYESAAAGTGAGYILSSLGSAPIQSSYSSESSAVSYTNRTTQEHAKQQLNRNSGTVDPANRTAPVAPRRADVPTPNAHIALRGNTGVHSIPGRGSGSANPLNRALNLGQGQAQGQRGQQTPSGQKPADKSAAPQPAKPDQGTGGAKPPQYARGSQPQGSSRSVENPFSEVHLAAIRNKAGKKLDKKQEKEGLQDFADNMNWDV